MFENHIRFPSHDLFFIHILFDTISYKKAESAELKTSSYTAKRAVDDAEMKHQSS